MGPWEVPTGPAGCGTGRFHATSYRLDLCHTDAPPSRKGWHPLPSVQICKDFYQRSDHRSSMPPMNLSAPPHRTAASRAPRPEEPASCDEAALPQSARAAITKGLRRWLNQHTLVFSLLWRLGSPRWRFPQGALPDESPLPGLCVATFSLRSHGRERNSEFYNASSSFQGHQFKGSGCHCHDLI